MPRSPRSHHRPIHPSPALLVALLALVVAGTGTAVAAGQLVTITDPTTGNAATVTGGALSTAVTGNVRSVPTRPSSEWRTQTSATNYYTNGSQGVLLAGPTKATLALADVGFANSAGNPSAMAVAIGQVEADTVVACTSFSGTYRDVLREVALPGTTVVHDFAAPLGLKPLTAGKNWCLVALTYNDTGATSANGQLVRVHADGWVLSGSYVPPPQRAAGGAGARPGRRRHRAGRHRLSGAGVQAVVFDLDGVLVESEELWDEVRRGLAADAGRPWPADATLAMLGMSTPEWSCHLASEVGIPGTPEALASAVIERMAGHYAEHLPLLPGAVAAVRRTAACWPLGLASSSPRRLIDAVLASAGLTDAFAVTVSTEEVTAGKPSPLVYVAAVAALGSEAACTVAVEDSSNGLRSAAGAGLIVVAVPHAAFPPAPDALARARTVLGSLDELTVDLIGGLVPA